MGLGKLSIKINGADCGAEAILLGVITSIGGFLFGYDTGQISSMLLFTDFKNKFAQLQDDGTREWVPIMQSLLVSLMSIGCLVGALCGAYTSDFLGRRNSLSFGVFVFVVGNIIQITAYNWAGMTAGRLVAGVGVGSLSVGIPMFQSECSPKEIRGAVVASYQLMITVGILISNLVNYGVREIQEQSASWRVVIGIGIFFSMFLGLGVQVVPESPRWLASRGRWDDARLSLARLRGLKDDQSNPLVENDLNEMRTVLEQENKVGTASYLECFKTTAASPKVLYRTLMGMAIHFLQQWTGVNYFFYYGASIFQSAGIDDPIMVQLILGAVNVVSTFPGLWAVEALGRRKPLFFGAIWQAMWLLVFAAVGVAIPPGTSSTTGIVMIVSACMFIASFAATWGPFAWVVIGESFPLRTRAKQASLSTSFNWLGNFLIGFLTPLADDGIGYAFGFVFFGCNAAAAALVYFFVYESQTLSLENVDVMYGRSDLKAWNSSKWVPAGYITRQQRDDAYFRNLSVSGPGNQEPKASSNDDNGSESREEHA